MPNVKRGLGKGLNALIHENDVAAPPGGQTVIQADINSIDNDPNQPRKVFDGQKLAELADSIKSHGIMQPILAIQNNDRYTIVAGERRFRAAKIAGLKSVPLILLGLSDKEKLEVALIENLQREDLNPMEQAAGVASLMEEYGLTQQEVSARVGKNRSTIANLLRLLELPQQVADMVRQDVLSASHARSLLPLIKLGGIEQAAKSIVENGWSVRQTEDYVRECENPKKPAQSSKKGAPQALPPELAQLQNDLCGVLETKVRLKGTEKSGKIIIDYYNTEQLEQLYDAICAIGENKLKIEN